MLIFRVFRGSVKNSEGDTRAAMHKAAEVWMKHVNIKLVESAQDPQINMSYQVRCYGIIVEKGRKFSI